jgi:transposase
MVKNRADSIDLKRQVAQDYFAGETLHRLAKHHDLLRNLIRIWVRKYEAGALEEGTAAAALLQCYEARIAALDSHCCARNYHKPSGPRPSNNRAKGSRHVPHAGTWEREASHV